MVFKSTPGIDSRTWARHPKTTLGEPGLAQSSLLDHPNLMNPLGIPPRPRRCLFHQVRRGLVDEGPEGADRLHGVYEILEVHGLDHVGVDPQVVGLDQVRFLPGMRS